MARVYSVHLSVRCDGETRRQEVAALLDHAAAMLEKASTTFKEGEEDEDAKGKKEEGSSSSSSSSSSGLLSSLPPVVALTLLGGDFNQPNEGDYPPDEWAAMAGDMERAKLPLSDGVRDSLAAAGFTPTFQQQQQQQQQCKTPSRHSPMPATTAWNGAVVDYLYVRHPPPQMDEAEGKEKKAGRTGEVSFLDCESTYIHSTLTSDHLPLIVDFRRRT